MTSFNPYPYTISKDHAALILRRKAFFEAAVERVADIVPECSQLWCYGLNALRPMKPSSDWDFIAFVPEQVSNERIDLLNDISGPLSEFRLIGNQTLDVGVMRIDDGSPCARLVRTEGFCFWQLQISLAARDRRCA
ncbi:hypothetical protein [Stutzerimonas stutzeri]|uniref:hypothetical protein n=1 Tax=Stutzerimonas stutzeri TaxID=316 RepID=UPI0015E3FB0B|nr:hypothetical protein [Stutzerimonas stutzeri]MBA1280327.1 hypothetical protein [Stutzerimonas stutzeri]